MKKKSTGELMWIELATSATSSNIQHHTSCPITHRPSLVTHHILIQLNQSIAHFMHPVVLSNIFLGEPTLFMSDVFLRYETWNTKYETRKWKSNSTGELMWIEPAISVTSSNLPHPAPLPITQHPPPVTHQTSHTHPVQSIHRSLYAPCCSIKHLLEWTHTVHAWCIFEIRDMKHENGKRKSKSTGKLMWIEPATSATSPNLQSPTSHTLPHHPSTITQHTSPSIYHPAYITNHTSHITYSSSSINPSLDWCTLLFYQTSSWVNPHCSCLMYFWDMRYKTWNMKMKNDK
jgi:hypothetical protein